MRERNKRHSAVRVPCAPLMCCTFVLLQSVGIHAQGKLDSSRDMRFPTTWHFDKWIFRRACAASCKRRNSKFRSVSSLSHRISKRLAKALTSLRVCAGWSEPLLVAHSTLLKISCHGSCNIFRERES